MQYDSEIHLDENVGETGHQKICLKKVLQIKPMPIGIYILLRVHIVRLKFL